MKRITLIFVALIALALPAAAIAHQGGKGKGHGKRCQALVSNNGAGHKAEGKSRKCEKKRLKLLARRAAVESCRDERGEDVRAFVQKYGPAATSSDVDEPGDESETDEPKGDVRSAFRHCVKLELKATKKAFKNAAQECRAERALDEDAFSAKYGTNANKRNAFGKCVSGHAKGDDEADNDGEQGGTESDAPDGGSELGHDNKED